MIAVNKVMYHYHAHNIYDDLWKAGNEIIVDKNFNLPRQNFIKNFSTGVFCLNPNGIQDISNIIDAILVNINTKEKMLQLKEESTSAYLNNMMNIYNLLKDSSSIIRYASIVNLEKAMEETRIKYYSILPSRFNSMFVFDEKELPSWSKKYSLMDADLYELSLTGNLFETSLYFTPQTGISYLDTAIQSHMYWNPRIETEEQMENREYLFNGKAKVLRKINKEI